MPCDALGALNSNVCDLFAYNQLRSHTADLGKDSLTLKILTAES